MTDSPEKSTAEMQAWIDSWKGALEKVLSQISGQPKTFLTAPDPLAKADTDLWYTITVSGGARGEMTLRLTPVTGLRLSKTFMGEGDSAEGELTPEYKEALEELLRQIAGLAATSMSVPGGAVQFQLAASSAPSWPSAVAVVLLDGAADDPLKVEIQMSAALVAALRPEPATATKESTPLAPPPGSGGYERLMDVNLEVKLRFGSRRMLLRDVLALSAGVVIELDRNLQAPADLLLDGRVIAQGEVVVVDGKYGMRITDVFEPEAA